LFNALESETYFRLGRKIAYFGDRNEYLEERYGQKGWVIPTMGGDFFLSRRFGYRDGIMGGNLWFLATTEESAIEAAEKAAAAVDLLPETVTTFPGGVAASASKAGSSYSFLIASTYAEFCPTLKSKLGERSKVPDGIRSIMEIIVNGSSLDDVAKSLYAAIDAARTTHGLRKISAGNYGGRLGKSFIYLLPDKHPPTPS
jgi:formylmethanofuran--tetrahydromethanopterin N-formyltransferase